MRPRHRRRRKKDRRPKWGFQEELELPDIHQACGTQVDSAGEGEGGGVMENMPPITRFVLEGSKLETKLSRMTQHGRSTYMEGGDYNVNPDPVPFMPQNFMSSTMVKKIPIPKRHQDTFGGYEYNFTGQRGVMLHTDRYQFEALRSFEGLNQRDRLLAEMEYLEQLRSIKRRRELMPHRAKLDLFMGGKKIEFEERFDINREIQKLKAMAMPQRARDLYHGKGIILPPDHMSIHPRHVRAMTSDSESEEEVRVSAPGNLQRMQQPFNLDLGSPTYDRQISLTLGDVPHTRSVIRGKRHGQLPSLKPKSNAGMQRDDTGVSKAPSLPNSSRSAAWVQEQNQLLPRSGSATSGSTVSRLEIHLPRSVEPERTEPERTGHAHDLSHDLDRPDRKDQEMMRILSADLDPATYADVLDLGPDGQDQRKKEPEFFRTRASSQGGAAQRRIEGANESSGTLDRREDSMGDKRLSPEAPPPTTEGGPRPVPDSRITSLQKSHTPNPLKPGLKLEVPADEETNLRQTFQRLDTDADGHLRYEQLKSQLPKEFSEHHEDFVKKVYELTSSSGSFFGVSEFLMMTQLTNRVASLSGRASEAFGRIDFDTLEDSIIKYVDLFQSKDSSQKGKITMETLRDLLSSVQNKPIDEHSDIWNTVVDSIEQEYSAQVNKIEYLAHIPLFMDLEPPSPQPQPQPHQEQEQ
ncbi:hypothetical protein BaRGS_00039257 [Batillaria attramentaria]|uniref:EF-hand domain-containing protein n=1 Tax=Batillaria attramentaria TaxID=370345 RepID=A0ABD0J3V4_9CAEN